MFQRWIPVTEEASTGPSTQTEDDTSAYIVRDTPSPTDAKTCAETNKTNSKGDTKILNIGEEQGEDLEDNVDLGEKSVEVDEGQAGSDPALEQVCANFEKRHKLHDKTIQGLSSRVFTLQLQDLPHKINETVKEAIQIALQALLKERFKDLDEFLAEKDKSCKRRWDDQDHPPPPIKESEQCKKKKQDNDASADDISLPDVEHILDLEDIGASPLPKIKTRPDWLKPIPEEDRPEIPESNWTVRSTDLPELENNWANAFATSKSKLYKVDLEGPAYKIDLVNLEGHWVVPNVRKPLPLRGYTIVSKPRAEMNRDKNTQKKIMRETRVHKFSDGMLTRILEKLDHMVTDFKLSKYNSGKEKRIWSGDDIRRSKEFMEVIERRLKIRRIFRSLGSFVSKRLRYVDYRLIQRTE
nr:hypothetical protein [Tanacetum cinerariifolium]